MTQHLATGWPNAGNMLRMTMLPYVGLKSCDRLAGALETKQMRKQTNRWVISFSLRVKVLLYTNGRFLLL